MGFSFRKAIRIIPGIHLNLSKTGVSTTIGAGPVKFNFGHGHTSETVRTGIPGLSWRNRAGRGRTHIIRSVFRLMAAVVICGVLYKYRTEVWQVMIWIRHVADRFAHWVAV